MHDQTTTCGVWVWSGKRIISRAVYIVVQVMCSSRRNAKLRLQHMLYFITVTAYVVLHYGYNICCTSLRLQHMLYFITVTTYAVSILWKGKTNMIMTFY